MIAQLHPDATRANQRGLMSEIAAVRCALERQAGPVAGPSYVQERETASALDRVCRTFGLSAFERSVLVMCAAIELDGSFGALCALAHGDPSRPYPTFGLALAALADAHWSALTPQSPLRRWSLVTVPVDAPLTGAPLRIDETMLHELAGVPELDARLRPFAMPVALSHLVPSQREPVERIARLLRGESGPALVQLAGADGLATAAVAAAAFDALQTGGVTIDARALPREPADFERLVSAWSRETRLHGTALYLDAHGLDDGPEQQPAIAFAERVDGPLIVGTNELLAFTRRTAYAVSIGKPTRGEQRDLWSAALGGAEDAGAAADALASQFDFGSARIRAAVDMMAAERGDARARSWSAACATARAGLDAIGQRLDCDAAAEALVLPPPQRVALADIVAHARNRSLVYEKWGMGRESARGLSVSALFYGPSGTGKTLAAEAIGGALGLDVYRVDLSRLVSKYIGETEKNLRRVFDAAEDGGVVLLFDECDAVFGKRGEVQQGHDRYANVEVSYLLQRMEAYRGVAILTTNMRNAIDPAFLRRIRFVVAFPFPDYEQRLGIWRRSFSPAVPLERLDFAKIARLNVAGGNIRNIALQAAFRAAEARRPVRMEDVYHASVAECIKLDRKPSDLEIGGWV